MVLLVLCILLLMQQDTTQQEQEKGGIPGHGVEAAAEYRTSFSCVGRVAGYYADIGSGCQLYHMCDAEGRRFTNACPNETLFQQRMMICDHWYMVNCNNSEHAYSANLLIGQRDKPFVSPEEHFHSHEPVHFFTTQQDPDALQQTNLFPEVIRRKQYHSEDTDSTVSTGGLSWGEIPADKPSYNESDTPFPSTNSRSRIRDINTSQSHTSSAATQRPTVNVPFGKKSKKPPQTLPVTYANDHFIQSLLLGTTVQTPQTIADISDHPDNRKIQNSTKYHLNGDETLRESRTSSETEELANTRFTSTMAPLSEEPLVRRAKELSIRLGNIEVQNLAASFALQKVPYIHTNISFIEPSTKVRTLALSDPVTPRSIEQRATTQINTNLDENVDDLNNVVLLHLLDPRRMFFIPESDENSAESSNSDFETGNTNTVFIPVPVYSRNGAQNVMHFRHDFEVTEGRNPDCPMCHPGFLLPGRCQPCVIIR